MPLHPPTYTRNVYFYLSINKMLNTIIAEETAHNARYNSLQHLPFFNDVLPKSG